MGTSVSRGRKSESGGKALVLSLTDTRGKGGYVGRNPGGHSATEWLPTAK